MQNQTPASAPSLRSTSLFSSLASPQGLALGTLLCAATPAWSQSPASAKPTQSDLPEVVVEANKNAANYKPEAVQSLKMAQPLRDIPQTITVVPKDVIEQRGATSLRDVLRNVPGISMQAGEGGGGPAGDNLSIRGFAARSDIFVDGIRDTAGGGYSRDPFNIEQVEVAKGPASTNTGRGSTGGSINLFTKLPTLDPFYRGDIGGGTDSYFRSTIDINVPFWVNNAGIVAPAPTGKDAVTGKGKAPTATASSQSGAAFRLNAMYHDQDIPDRDHVNNQRWGVAPSLAFGLGTDTRFYLSYSHLDQDNVPDYGIPFVPRNSVVPGAGGTTTTTINNTGLPSGVLSESLFHNFYGNLNRDHEFIKTDIATAILEHDFSSDLKWRTSARYGRNDRDSIVTAPRFIDRDASASITRYDNTELTRQFQSRDQIDESLALQSDLSYTFQTGSVKHQLATGVDLSNEQSHNDVRVISSTNPTTNVFNPNPYAPYTGVISYNGSYVETDTDNFGIYLFDTMELNKQWTFTGGVRWDSVDVDYTNVGPNPTNTRTDLSRDDGMFSWKAALAYKPAENGNVYLGYGTSFNPSTENLTYIAAPTGTNNTLSLFAADPEETRTLELGTKWDLLDNKLSLTAAVFRSEKTNARTTDPVDPTVVTLTGEQTVQGIELGFTGSITDKWRVFGGYTYLDSEVEDSAVAAEVGNELSNTPEHSFSLWTVHDIGEKVQAGVGVQFVGERYNNNNSLTRIEVDSYILVDAMVNYKVNDNISLRLNGYNLLDEEYLDRVGGGHAIPGAGRSFSLTASFNF